MPSTLGVAIRNARVAATMTQAALAKALGVSRQTVAGWESGRYRPQRRLLAKLEAALHLGAHAGIQRVLDHRMRHPVTEQRGLTWIELAREELGPTFSDADLDTILWEETGFPCYWPDRDKTPEDNCRAQLRAFKARSDAAQRSAAIRG